DVYKRQKVEPVKQTTLLVGIKTTGQIETLPSKKVEVTAPIPGTVVELLVEPGAAVKKGQPVAVLSSPELVELRVQSQEKQAEAKADLQQAQADLNLAKQNLQRQRQIAIAEIEQTRTELKVAQEQYDRDRDLVNVGALPRREMLESQAHLAEGKAQLSKANSRREVLEAEAQLKRAQSSVEVANSRISLSHAAYQMRLKQLGNRANEKGLVVVSAAISGIVSDRTVSLGQSFQDAGGKLMTVVNDNQVFATANIYEKDLNQIALGQKVNVKVDSLRDSASAPGNGLRTFSGQITRIGSVVESETRIIPVQAQLDNSDRQLKPGMFAQLEVLTNQTPTAILAIPSNAVVEAKGKQLIYIQNGDAYQSAEVRLGQTSGNMVEVKSGLFEGDRIVTQGGNLLYSQSLRSDNKTPTVHPETTVKKDATIPWWLVIPASGAIASAAFWVGRRTSPQLMPVIEISANKSPLWNDNHRVTEAHESTKNQK
ncbi:efflux RND transporter periplasmic adaptor subunit, partial [Chlorogloea sp. CCALA 695]|uniref:efflux RND transporter periplasmic adaptor subunit n=1 Tax=Chlorogloea sp. CCALA 695 TaxID=2107693 RepID=UPI000D04A4A8